VYEEEKEDLFIFNDTIVDVVGGVCRPDPRDELECEAVVGLFASIVGLFSRSL
jgi:hypothetical protein